MAFFVENKTVERAELLPMVAQLDNSGFVETALRVFRYQARYNPLYARWLELLGRRPMDITTLEAIPCLPIHFFKTHAVQTGHWDATTIFTSSATTGQTPSQHLVRDLDGYLQAARRGFTQFYGPPADWCTLALLPSYLERQGSSLVAMANDFIQQSRYPESGFFLHDFQALRATLERCQQQNIPTLLLGVSFALLDFAEQQPMNLHGITVMETGGMKGRRRELTRPEVHAALCEAFQLEVIHSEYGMTELFSQAYATGGTLFRPTPTMRVFATEINDPFCLAAPGRTGVLNIIDLANLDTCAFIATEDVGKVYADGRFEVMGRLDAAELRGCNLMVE